MTDNVSQTNVKNIAIIIDSLAGGGAEKVMLTLASEMLAKGHKVTFFSLKNTAQYDVPSGIELIFPLAKFKGAVRGWFNQGILANMLNASVLEAQQRGGHFDMVLVNLYESYRLASACQFKNCYYIIHNSYVQELKRERRMGPIKYLYMRRILKMLTGKKLIAVSKGVAAELRQASLFTPESVQHIYNPFNVDLIRQQAKEDIDANAPQKFVLHVGRAAKAKRHDVLFEAFKTVNPEYALVCLSSNNRKLEKLAKKHGIADRVYLPGFQENPYAWMNKSSALVLSSDFEGLSMVLLEAILSDTKVVSTNCPFGPNEILTGDLARFLVPVANPNALANAINEALGSDVNLNDVPVLDDIDVAKVAEKYLALV
ncbi:glycosyltransferase [Glaciecola siphonariae]|uniref:Glycosyltransferase n=1 Tax=Glaciecola siphonariae TaxID=521012 RepID=A0ABV9LYK6_9ALTE